MVPKANLLIYLTTPFDSLTATHAVLAELLVNLVKDDLRDISYMTEVAGLDGTVDTTRSDSVFLEFSGYSQKIDKIAETMLRQLRQFSEAPVNRQRWKIFAEKLQKEYGDFQRSSSTTQSTAFTEYCIRPVLWLEMERKKVLESMLADDKSIDDAIGQTRQLGRDLFRSFRMEVMACGNITAERALSLTKQLESILRGAMHGGLTESVSKDTSEPSPSFVSDGLTSSWLENQSSLSRRSLLLPVGCRLAHIRQQTDASHPNSAVQYYMQIGDPSNSSLRSHLFLLAKMLHEPLFHQLRTTEQLGYAVHASQYRSSAVEGLRVSVESNWDSVYVEQRIEEFLRSYQGRLDRMTEEEFNKSRQSAISLLQKKDDHWLQESHRWIRHIRSGYYEFDQKETDICCLTDQVTLVSMREFYRHYVNPDSPHRSKLSVHVRSLQPSKTAVSASLDTTVEEQVSAENDSQLLLSLLRDRHGLDLDLADLQQACASLDITGNYADSDSEQDKQNLLPLASSSAHNSDGVEKLAGRLFAHFTRIAGLTGQHQEHKLSVSDHEISTNEPVGNTASSASNSAINLQQQRKRFIALGPRVGSYRLAAGTRIISPEDLAEFRKSLTMSAAPRPVKPEFLKPVIGINQKASL